MQIPKKYRGSECSTIFNGTGKFCERLVGVRAGRLIRDDWTQLSTAYCGYQPFQIQDYLNNASYNYTQFNK